MTIQLSQAARPATYEVDAINEKGQHVPTPVAGEHPLTLYLDKREVVTLMTLGGAPEALAIGYLRNQRIIDSLENIEAVQVDWETDCVVVTTRGRDFWERSNLEARMNKRTVTTGCGQGTVFGGLMEEIDAIGLPASARLTEETLYAVMDRVRKYESIYKQAGAVHGCALCSNSGDDAAAGRGEILMFVEDVGRHNAVDAVAGQMWLDGQVGADKIFYTTGRLTSEMVIKCAQMGIPFLLSRSGLTHMGHEIARKVGITMIGRCQGKHYLLFTGAERFTRLPETLMA